jgi:hypothetical protein
MCALRPHHGRGTTNHARTFCSDLRRDYGPKYMNVHISIKAMHKFFFSLPCHCWPFWFFILVFLLSMYLCLAHQLMEALGMVYPQYWCVEDCRANYKNHIHVIKVTTATQSPHITRSVRPRGKFQKCHTNIAVVEDK